jgi:outer membrane protein TolC
MIAPTTQLFPVELALARARRDRLVAVVNLYRALAGGWQQKQEPSR